MSLKGTAALVTGASSGIGEATALALAAEGVKVALVARRTDRLEAVQQKIGESAIMITADVTDEEQATKAVDEAKERFGRLDTVVNNAGLMLLGQIENADITEWQRMVNINLLGLMYVAHAALPHLLEAAEGERGVADLVNISSVAGREVRMGSGAYNATKHGVGAFSEALRQEVTQRGVRVSLVEPGAVETELMSHNNEAVKARSAERFKTIDRLQAEDIAAMIGFIVTRPARMAINEVLVKPTKQV